MLVPEELSLIISSDPSIGAKNVSADGSYFEVFLDTPLNIPKDALNVSMTMDASNVWWSMPNILTGVNDKLYIDGDDTFGVLTIYTITIPQGLYDLNGLNTTILRQLEQQGAKQTPSPLITILGDASTNKIIIRFNYTNVEIDFTQTDTFREILGFDSQVLGPYVGAPTNITADSVAYFNQINYFLVHSDIVEDGILMNNTYNQIIGQVLIDVAPGSLIVSTPFNPPKINVQQLAGSFKKQFRFWITNDSNQRVDTNSEYWSARISIRWLRPFIIDKTDIKQNGTGRR